jgi:hypothetical protein
MATHGKALPYFGQVLIDAIIASENQAMLDNSTHGLNQ